MADLGLGIAVKIDPPSGPTFEVAPPAQPTVAVVPVVGPAGPAGAPGATNPLPIDPVLYFENALA